VSRLALVLFACAACGGGAPPPTAGTAEGTSADAGTGGGGGGAAAHAASSAPVDGPTDKGSPAVDAGPKDGRPFAGSTSEATELISAAVDSKRLEIGACVREFRTRRKGAQNRVAVSFGVDQEGKLLGVTSKGKEDAQLKACVQDALRGALFPRSHAGVITVTKSYEDILQ
jgi:hypothetical protein